MNKKADVAITLLVFMTLALVGAALIIFNVNQGKIETDIGDYILLNHVYLKENQIDFYVNHMLDNVVEDFQISSGREKFIENFRDELELYKSEQTGEYILAELENVNEQAENININENRLTWDLVIRMESRIKDEIIISHLYKKTFEKDL